MVAHYYLIHGALGGGNLLFEYQELILQLMSLFEHLRHLRALGNRGDKDVENYGYEQRYAQFCGNTH